MVVNIGAQSTQFSILTDGNIIMSRKVPIGGRQMNEAICAEIRKRYNLQIGTRLCIPGTADQLPAAPESCTKKHTVKAGDTLYLIAKMHNVKLDALMRANPHIDPYNMLVGTELCIPM